MNLNKNWPVYFIVLAIFIFWGMFYSGMNFLTKKTGILLTPMSITRHNIKGLYQYELGNYLDASKEYRLHYQIYYKMLRDRQNRWNARNSNPEKDKPHADLQNDPASASQKLGNSAWALYSEGRVDEAKSLADRALKIDPTNQRAIFTLSRLNFDENHDEETLLLIDRLLEKSQDQTDALVLQSAVYARQKEFNKAIDSLNKGLREYDDTYEVSSFVTVLQTLGELNSLPQEKRPYCLLAHYYRYLGIMDSSQGKTAIKYALKAIERNDRPDEAYMTIGLIYYKMGNISEGLENLIKAVSLNHRNMRALDRMSTIYGERNDLLNEYRATEDLAKSAPNDPFYTLWHVRFLRTKLGDYQQALKVAEGTLMSHPDDPELLHEAGLTYYEMGNYAEALQFEQKAVKFAPDDYEIHSAVGRIAEVEGRYADAYQEYETALHLAPFSSDVHLDMERVYEAQKRFKDAIKEYKIAFELSEDNINDVNRLCQLYYKISEYQYAVDCFKSILKRDPTNTLAKGLLSQSLQNINRHASEK